MEKRYIGIDMGAETIKVVELIYNNNRIELDKKHIAEHHNEPVGTLLKLLKKIEWDNLCKT